MQQGLVCKLHYVITGLVTGASLCGRYYHTMQQRDGPKQDPRCNRRILLSTRNFNKRQQNKVNGLGK